MAKQESVKIFKELICEMIGDARGGSACPVEPTVYQGADDWQIVSVDTDRIMTREEVASLYHLLDTNNIPADIVSKNGDEVTLVTYLKDDLLGSLQRIKSTLPAHNPN